MKKKETLYFGLLGLSLVLLILLQMASPKPIDWSESYQRKDKIPYGSYILYDLLDDFFPSNSVKLMDRSVYECLKPEAGRAEKQNLIYLNASFEPDAESFNSLLNYVQDGGNVLIAARSFSPEFEDSLLLSVALPIYNFYKSEGTDSLKELDEVGNLAFSGMDSVYFHFKNSFLRQHKFRGISGAAYFESYDAGKAEVLGEVSFQGEQRANFIRYNLGEGSLYVHSDPEAFSNLNLLDKHNLPYLGAVFGYMPDRTVYWDAYYKVGRKESSSSFRYVLSQPSLKYALYTLLAGLFLFVLFEGKRKQRLVPVIEPLKNATLEFTRTIAALYWETKQHKRLAEKKIAYFKEHIRSTYFMPVNERDQQFFQQLAMKSGHEVSFIEHLFQLIEEIENSPQISDEHLLKLNRAIETFNQKTTS